MYHSYFHCYLGSHIRDEQEHRLELILQPIIKLTVVVMLFDLYIISKVSAPISFGQRNIKCITVTFTVIWDHT